MVANHLKGEEGGRGGGRGNAKMTLDKTWQGGLGMLGVAQNGAHGGNHLECVGG